MTHVILPWKQVDIMNNSGLHPSKPCFHGKEKQTHDFEWFREAPSRLFHCCHPHLRSEKTSSASGCTTARQRNPSSCRATKGFDLRRSPRLPVTISHRPFFRSLDREFGIFSRQLGVFFEGEGSRRSQKSRGRCEPFVLLVRSGRAVEHAGAMSLEARLSVGGEV